MNPMMVSSSTQPSAMANKSVLTPVMTLKGHEWIVCSLAYGRHYEKGGAPSISYFPNRKQMISASGDGTIRRWDLQEGKEIKEAREVFKNTGCPVGVSRDGRWVVTACQEVKVSEVETGIVRTFHDDEDEQIDRIDISMDSKLLAGGSVDHCQAWIWRLDTGELVAGPFYFGDCEAFASSGIQLRLSEDSRKLAVLSDCGCRLQVWDVQTQKLDVQKFNAHLERAFFAPIFWTTKHKSIVAAFNLTNADATIYEFDTSTLETVEAPFKGHTDEIGGLALSSDRVLLVSSSFDGTIKLWAFQSRQLLASFDFEPWTTTVDLSPDSHQIVYTIWEDCNIYICNIPVKILASIGLAEEPQPSVCTH